MLGFGGRQQLQRNNGQKHCNIPLHTMSDSHSFVQVPTGWQNCCLTVTKNPVKYRTKYVHSGPLIITVALPILKHMKPVMFCHGISPACSPAGSTGRFQSAPNSFLVNGSRWQCRHVSINVVFCHTLPPTARTSRRRDRKHLYA